MQSEFRVTEIYTEEDTGDVIARCYDIVYGEYFEKFLGQGDDFDSKENASSLLNDPNYEIPDEIRADIEDIFGVAEFEDEQDYDGYQFYDFDDEDEEDDEMDQKALAILGKRESFNLREALNQIDLDTYNKYDLLNLYESCNLSENEKRALANIVYDQEDPSVIYDTLNNRFLGKEIEMPERVKDGVIHEEHNDVSIYTAYDRYDDPMETFDSEKDAMDYVEAQEDYDRVAKVTKQVGKREVVIYREDDGMNESKSIKEDKDEFEFDDEFNAYYDGYTEEDKDKNSAYNRLKDNQINESDDEQPYTKEQIEADLKSITNNFTEKEGELKCGFKEEKDFGVEILKQHYKVVETSGDDRRDDTWYHISYAEPIK